MQRDELVNAAREASASIKEKAAARMRSTTPGQAMTLLAAAVALLMVVSCFAMGVGLAQQEQIERPVVVTPSDQIAALRAEIELYSQTETFLLGELKTLRAREADLRAENKRLLTGIASTDRIKNQKMDEVMSAIAVQRINNTYKETAESFGLPLRDFTGEPHCLVTDNGSARIAVFNRLPGLPGMLMSVSVNVVTDDSAGVSGHMQISNEAILFHTSHEGKLVAFLQAPNGQCKVFSTTADNYEEDFELLWEGRWR